MLAAPPTQACPHCKVGRPVHDEANGEEVCNSCGAVIMDKIEINHVDRRHSDRSEEGNRNFGPPESNLFASNSVSVGYKDASGQSMHGQTEKFFHKLRYIDRRIKKDFRYRNLNKAAREINRVSDLLGLGPQAKEKVGYYYRKAMELRLIKGRSINGIAAACIYLVSRECGTFRSAKEISRAFNIEETDVTKAARLIENRLEIRFTPVPPSTIVGRHMASLDLSEKTRRTALAILDAVKGMQEVTGKNPQAIAASAIYIATIVNGEYIKQDQLVKACGVSIVSIRKRVHDLVAILPVEYSGKFKSRKVMTPVSQADYDAIVRAVG